MLTPARFPREDAFGGLGRHELMQAVPEPGKAALLIAGLGYLAARLRRLKARPASPRPMSARLAGSGTG